MSALYTLSGTNGTLYIYDSYIEIVRKGILAKLSHVGMGNTVLNYTSISSVQFRPGTPIINGYIHFFRRGNRSGGGYINAISDEDSVVFRLFHNEEARSILRYVKQKI